MPNKTKSVDQFLLIHSARADNWREITTLADAWAANRGERAALEAAIAAVAATEEYHAYPGARLLAALMERIATNEAGGAARLARRISNALLTHAYRGRPSEWDVHEDLSATEVADVLPHGNGEAGGRPR
jgi:arginine decarboxylase